MLAAQAQELGAAAISALSPSYFKPRKSRISSLAAGHRRPRRRGAVLLL
jgi:dihydrodipicolinate synthase/N-acetylneuraminate lyase